MSNSNALSKDIIQRTKKSIFGALGPNTMLMKKKKKKRREYVNK